MKKTLALVMALLMVLSFAAFSAADENTEWKFERDIELVICNGEGGGVDTTFRTLIPYLEKELGVNIIPNNVTGGSGINGMEYVAKQPADGYTFVTINPSPLSGALQGKCSWDMLNELQLVACVVYDIDLIMVGKDSPYQTFEDIVNACKAEPGSVTVAVASLRGIDGGTVGDLCDKAGFEMEMVAYDGSEPIVAVMQGECDAVVGCYTECAAYIESGDLRPIIVLNDARIDVLPDCPCSVELGFDATMGPWRGLGAYPGTPEGAVKAMAAAIEKVCTTDPEWQNWLKANALDVRPGYRNSEDFTVLFRSYVDRFDELFSRLGQ